MDELLKRYLDVGDSVVEEASLRTEEARRKVYDSRRELEASGYDLSSSAAQAIATITGSEAAQSTADRHKKIAQIKRENTDFTQSLWDVDSVGSALSYAHKTAVNAVPSIALAAAGGVAGMGLRAAGALGSASAPVAAGSGMALATYLPNTGEVFENMREQAGPGGESVPAGLVLGAGSTALDLFGVGSVVRKAVTREASTATGRLGRRVATEGLKVAGTEGVTEAGQQVLSEAGRAYVDPEGYRPDKEALKRVVESGVAGAIGGFAPGALHGARGRKETGPGGDKSPIPSSDTVSASSRDPMTDYKGSTVERVGPQGEVIKEVDPATQPFDVTDGKSPYDAFASRRVVEPEKKADLLSKEEEPRIGPNGEVISAVPTDPEKAEFGYQSEKISSAYEDFLREKQQREGQERNLVSGLATAQTNDPTGARALVPASYVIGDKAENLRLSVSPLGLAKESSISRGRRNKLGVGLQTKLEESWADSLSTAIAEGPQAVSEFLSKTRAALNSELPKKKDLRYRSYRTSRPFKDSETFKFFEKVGLDYLDKQAKLSKEETRTAEQNAQDQAQAQAAQAQAAAQQQVQAQQQAQEDQINFNILEKALIGNEPKSMEQVLKAFKGLRAELAPEMKDAPVPQNILALAEQYARDRAQMEIANKVSQEQQKLQDEQAKRQEAEQKKAQDDVKAVQETEQKAKEDALNLQKKEQDLRLTEEKAQQDKAVKEAAEKKSALEKKAEETKAKKETEPAKEPAKTMQQKVRESNEAVEKEMTELKSRAENVKEGLPPGGLEKLIAAIERQKLGDAERVISAVEKKLGKTISKLEAKVEQLQEKVNNPVAEKPVVPKRETPKVQQPTNVANENKGGVPSLQERIDAQKKEAEDKLETDREPPPKKNQLTALAKGDRARISLDEARSLVSRWTKTWANAPKFVFVETDGPPPSNQVTGEFYDHYHSYQGGIAPAAAYDPVSKTVAVFSESLTTPEELKATVYHEALGHYGLQEVFGEDRQGLMASIYLNTPEVARLADKYAPEYFDKEKPETDYERAILAEEVLVNEFNTGNKSIPRLFQMSWWQKVIALIDRFARRMGWRTGFSTPEIMHILQQSQDAVIKGKSAESVVVPEDFTIRNRLVSVEEGINKLPPALQPMSRRTFQNVRYMAQNGLNLMSSLRDFTQANQERLPALKDYRDAVIQRDAIAREMETKINLVLQNANELKTQKQIEHMSEVATKLTLGDSWYAQPAWLTKKADITPEAQALWNSLDKDQQKVLDEMFKSGWESLLALKDAVARELNSRAEGPLYDALSSTDKAEVKKDVANQLKIWDTKLNQVKGPYIPISRFGKYIVVAKSPEFIKLDDIVTKNPKATKEETDRLNEMRMDPEHYMVMYRDTYGLAKELESEIMNDPDYKHMETHAFEKEAVYRGIQTAPWASLQNLKQTIEDELGDQLNATQLNQIDTALKNIYFAALAENSTRRHLSKRRKVPGMSKDVLHSFDVRGKADAHFIADVRKNKDIMQSINDMRKQRDANNVPGSEDRATKSQILNEVLHRKAMDMASQSNPVVDKIKLVTSGYFLLTSPRYYLQQVLQTPMVSAPYMAGRFGYDKTWKAIWSATKDWRASVPNMSDFFLHGKFDTGTLNEDGTIKGKGTLKDAQGKALPDDEVRMLNEIRQRGVFDVGLQYELGAWENFGRGGLSHNFKNAVHKLRSITRAMEIGNRMSAGLAAYRLAKESRSFPTYESRRDYVEKVLSNTHGDYSHTDRARLFGFGGAPGSLFFQFRRYSHAIGSMLVKEVNTAFRDADPKERSIARWTLGYMLGQTALVTGALGLPVFSQAAYLMAAAFGPDDEPADTERWLRQIIGDENIANLLLKGAPNVAGLDLSSMLGMENVFRVAPFVDFDVSSRDKAAATAFYSLAGPMGGLVGRGADAVGHFSEGNIWKGIENTLPGLARTTSMAVREANQGVTKKNGDLVISPEEFSFMETLMKSMGINTTHMEKIRRERHDMFALDEYFKNRTGDIRKEFVEARKERDTDKQAQLREEWKALQEAKKRYGFTVSPLGNLLSAETQVKSREERYRELLRKFSSATAN